jgi:aryl-alcohol dehydrogenase-like predicted oxidoreductase/enamine deaminase RidA (YjgF/YER057c/UK114 family)
MDRVTLAPGLDISRVVTGLWQVADMERGGAHLDLAAASAAMLPYVEAGLTTFDMADHYGSAELIAGAFARRYGRDHPVELLTKWVPTPGPISRESTRAAVERALSRLQRERIDLLQFHTWAYHEPGWLDALGWLQELRDEGLIGAIGVTNFDAAHLRVALASGLDVVSNQVSFSLLDRRAAGDLAEVCARWNVRLLAYGTVAGGLLTEKWLGAADVDADDMLTWSQKKYRRFIEAAGGWDGYQGVLRALASVAARRGCSMASVAERFVLESPAVAAVVVGARLGETLHAADNAGVARMRLEGEDVALLHEAVASLRPVPGDCGDEYRRPPYLTAAGDLSDHVAAFPAPFETRELADGRVIALSGTIWESVAGFARAVRVGDHVHVSGTTATHRDRMVGGDDVEAQTHAAIDKVEAALVSLGATLEDVVRTRVYVRDLADWEGASRAHGRRFGHIMPANTLVQAGLIGEGYRVEVEAEAVVGGV